MLVSMVVFYLLKDKYVTGPDGRQLGVRPNKYMDMAPAAAIGGDEETGMVTGGENKTANDGAFSSQQLIILIGGIIAAFSIIHFVIGVDIWGSLIYGMTLVAPFVIITDTTLTKVEKDRLWVIILIMIFVVFFWMCFEQAGASLTAFAANQTDRTLFGWTMPASYFQSFNAGFIVILAPIISVIWVRLARKGFEPSAPYKQSMGLAMLAVGYLFIAMGAKDIPSSGASMIWLTGLYFLHTIGELFLSPIGLSMVNKLTPGRFTSLMMGVWFLAIATGNKLAGTMSALYPDPASPTHPKFLGMEISNLYTYFMIFVGFAGAASVILFLLCRKLQKMMHGIR
jgi:proton-dependent oligopeptide transporter, POT family